MFRPSLAIIATLSLLPAALAQQPVSRVQPVVATGAEASVPGLPSLPAAKPKPVTGTAPNADGFKPTWETQKGARTYMLGIPAPRGQIVDRNGLPLAQTRVSYNLGLSFPTPLKFSETEALLFAEKQVTLARALTGRQISLTQDQVLKHYKNRGIVPLVIAQDLRPMELDRIHTQKPENLVLQPVYQRYYPNGNLACHIVGYAGRSGKMPDGVIENNELLWPNAEGRAGLEQTFDDQLQGKVGQYNISFDASGKKATEQISIPPQPGYNVVTTLDLNIQQLCEQSLAKGVKRGALVIVDPNNGDILAMASWPTFNPNLFIPNISNEAFALLRDDPENPLIPRAYQAAYPPGSTYKIIVGLAALQTGKVKIDDEFSCPPSMEIGNLTFRNWKKTDSGSMNFAEALTQSCDTWFYQVGMKIGSRPIIEYSQKLGLGMRTGIPLAAESGGRIPTDEYMLRAHKRKLLNGDIANMSIGQGDIETTPLQIAQAMVPVANGGTLYQMRLVQQVQSIDNQIVTAYDVRARGQVDMDKEVIKEIRKGMIGVVESGSGTAGRAQIDGIHVAGKTGTAQWGPKNAQRVAAWFCGFAPADKPRYAFATIFESDVANNDVHGGTVAAPLVANVLKELFKDEVKAKKGKKKPAPKKEEDDDEEKPVRRAEPVDRD